MKTLIIRPQWAKQLMLAIVLLSTHAVTVAQTQSKPTSQMPQASVPVGTNSNIELQKYELEKQKLWQQWVATVLTFFTVATGLGTIAYNIRNSSKQAQLQAKLKAIDVVISAAGPKSAQERLTVVNDLLGPELALDIKPEELSVAGVGAGHDQNRRELLKMLIDNPDRQLEVLELWQVLFGKGQLASNLRDLRSCVERRQVRD